MSWTGPSSVWGSDSLFQRHSELFLWGHVKSPPIMLSSLLQAADHVTEQEVRSEHRQDGAPWGPGQAVRLIYTHSTGTQGPQGVATTLPAAMQCHQDDTERAVEDAKLLPHLAKLSGETLQRKNASYSWIISDLSHLFVPVYKKIFYILYQQDVVVSTWAPFCPAGTGSVSGRRTASPLIITLSCSDGHEANCWSSSAERTPEPMTERIIHIFTWISVNT